MRYKTLRARPSRSVNDRIHNIRTFATAALAVLVAGALENTCLSRMPFGLKGSPALLLLVVITLGYWFGEQAGALCGVFAGVIADVSVGGVMLSPMMLMLLGYVCGIGAKRFLAGNLPSFLIFCIFGIVWKSLWEAVKIVVVSRGLPPLAFLTEELLPNTLLTLMVAPLFYALAKGYVTRKSKR